MIKEIDDGLRNLIETCQKAADFHQEEAMNIKSDKLRAMLCSMSETHKEVISNLQSFIIIRGGDISSNGTILNKILQVFSTAKTTPQSTEKMVIIELENVEKKVIEKFHDFLTPCTDVDTRRLLYQQLELLRKNNDYVLELVYSIHRTG